MAIAARGSGFSRRRMVLFALSAITLLSLDLSGFGPIGSVQRFARGALSPVTSVAATVVSPVTGLWNAAFNYDDLEADRDFWRSEAERLEGEGLIDDAQQEAFRRLLEAAEITYLGDVDRATAAVIRTSVGNFDTGLILIDKGSNDGIEPGMAVTNGAGLVGRIDEVDSGTASVQLLSDPEMVVGVRLSEIDELGVGSTVPGLPQLLRVQTSIPWPEDDDLSSLPNVGTTVVTAPLSRYPAEIPLGRIVEVSPDDRDEPTVIVDVEIAADLDSLGFVSVMLVQGLDELPLTPPTPSTTTLPPDPDEEDG